MLIKKIKLRGIFNTSQINNDSYLKLKIGNWDSSNDNQKILLKQNDSILHSGDIITLKNANYTPECENNNMMLLNPNTMKVTTNKNYYRHLVIFLSIIYLIFVTNFHSH